MHVLSFDSIWKLDTVDKLVQWSPSNPDTVGTQCLWPDYLGVHFSGVIGTMWVWLNSISNDVM